MDRKKITDTILSLTKIVPYLLIIPLIILWFAKFRHISLDDILNYTPGNLILAGLLFVLFFAIKSLVIFFPVTILYIAVGTIFSPFWAFLININGAMVCSLIPYLLGKLSGKEMINRLISRYPKTGRYLRLEKADSWTYAYMLRLVTPLPIDLRNMLLGAMKVPFKSHISGSIAASLPFLITLTFLGNHLENPKSKEFIIALVATAALSVISILLVFFLKKVRNNNKEKQ